MADTFYSGNGTLCYASIGKRRFTIRGLSYNISRNYTIVSTIDRSPVVTSSGKQSISGSLIFEPNDLISEFIKKEEKFNIVIEGDSVFAVLCNVTLLDYENELNFNDRITFLAESYTPWTSMGRKPPSREMSLIETIRSM